MKRGSRLALLLGLLPLLAIGCSSTSTGEEGLSASRWGQIALYGVGLVGSVVVAKWLLDYKDDNIR